MRIVFTDLRDAKFAINMLVVVFFVVMAAMGLMIPSSYGGLSLGFSSGFLAYTPLFMLQIGALQSNKTSRMATLASLPMGGQKLSLARYGAAVVVQLGVAAIFLALGLLTHFNGSDPVEGMMFALNCALLGLGLMAIELLIIDLFPRLAPTVGSLMLLSVVFLPRGGFSDWLWNHLGDPQFLVTVAVLVFAVIGLEVYVFCRHSSLV